MTLCPVFGLAQTGDADAALEGLAEQIAKLSQEPGFRGFLRSEIAKSKNRENILELDEFLDRAGKAKGAPPGLAKAKQSAAQARGRVKDFSVADRLDLYIPVDAHRAKWKGGKDFLVAASPVADEEGVTEIVAYSVADGRRVTLDPNTPPEQVVMVVAACEHETHEAPVPPKADAPLPEGEPKPNYKGKNPPEKAVEPEGGNSQVGFHFVKIYKDHEPWTRGDPEIMMFFGMRRGNECVHDNFYTDCPSINKEGSWYNTWEYCACTCSNEKRYFDANYASKAVVYIYERDGGSRDTKIYQLYPGVTCSWPKYTGDDYVDSTTMYLTNFPFAYDYYQNIGDAYLVWRKEH